MAASAKKLIRELKTLRVADLEDKSVREVWCLNNTKPKGEIALGVKSQDGSVTLVTIAATWIPICLTEQVPKQMLLGSPDFRKLVSTGGITIVEPKMVLDLLGNPDIKRESLAIINRNKSDAIADAPTELPKENYSMLVLDIVARETNNEITEQGSLDILYTQEDSLTNDDLEYLVKNSAFQKVKTWAAETLTARGEDED
jgi:hypothetical protein